MKPIDEKLLALETVRNKKVRGIKKLCNGDNFDYFTMQAQLEDDYLFFSSYEFFMNQGTRENTGAVYTPEWVVHYMCDNLLNTYLKHNSDLWNIKVLDPSCGSGNFTQIMVSKLCDLLVLHYPQKNQDEILKHVLTNVIYGWDINPDSVKVCTRRLEYFFGMAPKNIQLHNTLMDEGLIFDIIIGNPPYGDLLSKSDKTLLKDQYGNIALNFIDWALDHLAPTGEMAMIVPHSFTRAKSKYCIWRKKLYSSKSLHTIVDVGNPFCDITLEEVIFFFNKKQNTTILSHSLKEPQYNQTVPIDLFYNQNYDYKMMIYADSFYYQMQENKLSNPFSGKRGQDISKSQLKMQPSEGYLWHILGKNITKDGLKNIPNYDCYIHPEQCKTGLIISSPVVAITQFGSNLKACLLDSTCFPSGGTVVVNHEGISAEECIAYLNQPSINHYLKKYVFGNADLTVHIDGVYLQEIPYVGMEKLKELESLIS